MTLGTVLIIGLISVILIIIFGTQLDVWDHNDTHTYE